MPAYVPLFSYSTMDMRDSLFVDENEKTSSPQTLNYEIETIF